MVMGIIEISSVTAEKTYTLLPALILFPADLSDNHKQTPCAVSTIAYHLDLDGTLKSLALLVLAGVGLGTHDTTSPVALRLLDIGHVTLLDGGDELGVLGLVFGADLGESEDCSGLVPIC